MEIDSRDIAGDTNGTSAISVSTDKQEEETKLVQDESPANKDQSAKEQVEILSVEVVKSPVGIPNIEDEIAGNDMMNTCENIVMEQPVESYVTSFDDKNLSSNKSKSCNNVEKTENTCGKTTEEPLMTLNVEDNIVVNKVNNEENMVPNHHEINNENSLNGKEANQRRDDCYTNTDKQEECDAGKQNNVDKETVGLVAGKEQIAVDQQNYCSKSSYGEEGGKESTVCESITDAIQSEDSSNNAKIQEDIQDISQDVCIPMEDEEISGNLSTSTEISGLDVQQKLANPILSVEENVDTNTTINSTTGLSLLAQYGSDDNDGSDNDSVIEIPTANQDYRSKIVEIDSDSDSSSSDSDVEYLNKIRKTIEKRMEVDDDDDCEDDDDDGNSKTKTRKKPTPKVKAKGELQLDDLPPIEDLQITVAEEECIVLGKIHSIVDQLVLVSALPDSVLVDLETVLFLDKGRKVLGEVFDVLGQVADPLYCVRFNSNEQINEKNIKINDVVYLAPKTPYTQYIILSSIMRQKGSDASWENDLEPPPRFLDYSDDEQQQLARRKMRNGGQSVEHDEPQKRLRKDAEEPQVSSVHNRSYSSQPRQRCPPPPSARGSGPPPNRGFYGRPHQHYNSQYRNPQTPSNHNPSSWHSNYYPQAAITNISPQNIPFAGGYQRMPQQSYPPVPVYPMNIPYPPPLPPVPHQQNIRFPPNNNPVDNTRFMPNAFNMRPPTIPAHFDPSTLPPGTQ